MPITINNVRFSYTHLFTPVAPFGNPTADKVYSTVILIPKSNKEAVAALNREIDQVKQQGAQSKWGGTIPQYLTLPVHDGDGQKPRGGEYGEECRGCWVLNAKSRNQPFVVDRQVQPIIDPTEVYSGMWGNVSLSLFPYSNSGNTGIGVGLNGVQKTRDDAPLGGERISAEDAFTAVAAEASDGLPDWTLGI